ncbi:MAG: nucleoside deaminase [Gallicola sp.]|nr:nucleoside deaminase [Gallicola sp.]
MDYIKLLKEANKEAIKSKESGNHPFGAVLVDENGEILLRQGNLEVTENISIGHAETMLMEAAGKKYSKEELWNYTMVTTCEPCVMCCGACYWTNVGRIVYGLSEEMLLKLTGDDERNPTFDLSSREVISRGQKEIEILGPFPELEEELLEVHKGYWNH